MAYTVKEIQKQPVRLLEQAAAEGSESVVFKTVEAAKEFYKRVRALNAAPKGMKFNCAVGRTENVVWAAADDEALPEATLGG